jgi:hypothetical protein
MQNKTMPNHQSVEVFLERLEDPRRRAEGHSLLETMRRISGCAPVMWGDSIVGFGRYHYHYESGREGDYFRIGFSPRKAALSIYLMPGYQDYQPLLTRLGKHKTGKSCLYISRLSDVDPAVLEELIGEALERMDQLYPVQP